jgi:hypothetical protein
MGRRRARKKLREAASDLLMVSNELALRARGDCVSADEARELANRIREAVGMIAVVTYELEDSLAGTSTSQE